jgi:hypothetical protein
VLSLFKEYGAPHRLTLIFEGESLFNDGTAFAIFLVILVILEFMLHGYHGSAHQHKNQRVGNKGEIAPEFFHILFYTGRHFIASKITHDK